MASATEQVRRLKEAGVGDGALELRLIPLDPRRTAPDLLEDLLTCLAGRFLLWREYADEEDDSDDGEADQNVGRRDEDLAAEDAAVTDGALALDGAEDDEDDGYVETADQFREEPQHAMQAVGSPA